MAILKKRPSLKTADDFINANPETIVEKVLTEPVIPEVVNENKTEPVTLDEGVEEMSLKNKAKVKFMSDEDNENQLRRVTTYVKGSLSDKIKILAVLTKNKEYQLWNEALTDLLDKYKEKGF